MFDMEEDFWNTIRILYISAPAKRIDFCVLGKMVDGFTIACEF